MKVRIDLRPVLRDHVHPVRIALYIMAAIVILLPLQEKILHRAGWGNKGAPACNELPPACPAVLAGGIETAEGRLQFAGASARGVWSGQVSTVLVALVIAYVVGPAALVWGLRAWSRYRQHIAVRGGATSIGLALAFGGSLLATVLAEPVYAVVGTRQLAMLMRDDRFRERYDALETELYAMAKSAQVRYFRSGTMRGHGHSWLTGDRSRTPAIRIGDVLDAAAGRVAADTMTVCLGSTTFSLHVDRADSLTIRGSVPFEGNVRLPDPPEWTPHTISAVVGVTPLNVNMIEEE
jgi:hypothetical protein